MRLLCHDVEEARLLLETQQDGYFDCAEFLAQVGSAVNIIEENCFCLIMHQFIARVGRCTQRTTYECQKTTHNEKQFFNGQVQQMDEDGSAGERG